MTGEEENKGPSKNALKKAKKDAEKAAKKAAVCPSPSSALSAHSPLPFGQAAEARGAEGGDASEADVSEGLYGVYPLIRSTEKKDIVFTLVKDLTPALKDKEVELTMEMVTMTVMTKTLEVTVRGRLHTSRSKGKNCFFVLRQQHYTLQALLFVGDAVSKQFLKWAAGLPRESILDVTGAVKTVDTPITACSQQLAELHVTKVAHSSSSIAPNEGLWFCSDLCREPGRAAATAPD